MLKALQSNSTVLCKECIPNVWGHTYVHGPAKGSAVPNTYIRMYKFAQMCICMDVHRSWHAHVM